MSSQTSDLATAASDLKRALALIRNARDHIESVYGDLAYAPESWTDALSTADSALENIADGVNAAFQAAFAQDAQDDREARSVYRIENAQSGLILGDYEGATGDDAILAMLDDAGCAPDLAADPALVATLVSDREARA